MRRLTLAVVVLTCLVVVPSWSFAQSSITGVVRDTSGAVLPGVNVEASSDVLIEKVRSAVTDDTGQYRILELRPGTYTVTFTLTGFSTVKREQLELPADFVSTVNVEMRLGTLEETVTVTGESPIVDVQSARRRRTLDENLIESIPTAQGYAAVMVLMPSMIQSNGGNNNVLLNPGMIVFGGRGGRGNEGIAQTDGIGTGAAINGGGVSGYGRLDTTEEVVLTASGGLGDVEVGGPIVNLIPRNGSNTVRESLPGVRPERLDAGEQLHAGAERCRPAHTVPNELPVGCQPDERRPDCQGPLLVLLRDQILREMAPTSQASSTTGTPATSPSGTTIRTSIVQRTTARLDRSLRRYV